MEVVGDSHPGGNALALAFLDSNGYTPSTSMRQLEDGYPPTYHYSELLGDNSVPSQTEQADARSELPGAYISEMPDVQRQVGILNSSEQVFQELGDRQEGSVLQAPDRLYSSRISTR
jgi:hypothetical protein